VEKEKLKRNALKTGTSPLGTSSLSLKNKVFPTVIRKGGSQQKTYTPENEALCISLLPQKRIKPQGLIGSYRWSD
jgi:hypothetical protein